MTLGEAVAIGSLVVVIAGSALLVDPRAHASFDAPKRLVALAGAALAAFAALAFTRRSHGLLDAWRTLPAAARVSLIAASAGLLWCAVSATLSPRQSVSLDTLRAMVLLLLLVPLGASGAVARGRNLLVAAFLAATALNAGVSILQSRGIQPLRLQTFGTRNETGALAGNVGYLAITVALAAVLTLGVALSTRHRALRAAAGALLLLLLATLLVNRNLTALVSVAAGATAFLVARFGRRSLLSLGALAVLLVAGLLVVAPLRARTAETLSAVRRGDWDRLTTYRTGPWAAALEMARERPITGWGPGTFAAEFVPHRLQAEIRARKRLINPLLTSSYSEAHCDYLQAFAEVGIPGGLAALVAVVALLVAVGRGPGHRALRSEEAVLFGLLVAGATAALTWFPLQRPISAAPLLLAAGRGWRLASARPHGLPSP